MAIVFKSNRDLKHKNSAKDSTFQSICRNGSRFERTQRNSQEFVGSHLKDPLQFPLPTLLPHQVLCAFCTWRLVAVADVLEFLDNIFEVTNFRNKFAASFAAHFGGMFRWTSPPQILSSNFAAKYAICAPIITAARHLPPV